MIMHGCSLGDTLASIIVSGRSYLPSMAFSKSSTAPSASLILVRPEGLEPSTHSLEVPGLFK
jgi:hypothetical protein